MRISIIIPVLNESKNIDRMIEMLEQLDGDKELIFVDGGSTDATKELIPPAYMVVSTEPGRGRQLNKGAECATGDVMLFLHCDSILGSNGLRSIEEAAAAGYQAGCFSMSFDSKHWLLSIIAYLSNCRARLLGIIFGDQGMFVTKDLFQSLGGFSDIPIMEDLEFSGRLRKAAKLKQLKDTIVTSARRFERKGILRTILFMHKMKLLYWMRKSPEELYRIYRNVR